MSMADEIKKKAQAVTAQDRFKHLAGGAGEDAHFVQSLPPVVQKMSEPGPLQRKDGRPDGRARLRKGRTCALNIRIRPELYDALSKKAGEKGILLVDATEEALEAWLSKDGAGEGG